MQTITNEQIYDRWEQVPEALKEAFFSTDNGEIVWKVCEDAGLSEEVIDNILVVVGNVLFGFTHINDFAKELQSIPGMDQKAVDPIIFQIDNRIFGPIKGEILRLYGVVSGTGPKMVAEEGRVGVAATTDQPKILTDRVTPVAPVEVQTTQLEIRKVRIGGEESSMAKSQDKQIEASRPELAEGPSIIHEEIALKPVTQKRQPLSSFGGMFGFHRRTAEQKDGPAVTAQVSMIEGVGRKPDEMGHTEQQVKVVHYTSARVPEDMFGQASRPQIEAGSPVAVSKQEREFEPKVVNLAEHPATKDEVLGQAKDVPIQGGPIVVEQQQQTSEAPRPIAQSVPTPEIPVVVQSQTVEVTAPPISPLTQLESANEGAMPFIQPATVMKTPQRPEVTSEVKKQEPEPRLTEIPVTDDIVDLRMLERVTNNQQPKTDNQ